MKKMKKSFFAICHLLTILIISPVALTQSTAAFDDLDQDFVESLPEDVRKDILSEMKSGPDGKGKENNIQKRPSSKLSKLDTVKDWENFKKKQQLKDTSERYGMRIFNTMQSSFMPLNEPNFGNNYIVDYGDYFTIQLFGNVSNNNAYQIEVERDGTILLEDIGKVVIAGLNFEQATDIIQKKYSTAFIGVDVVVTLSEIRDINILVTGNVEFPGMYTLSGNSNILQALNIAGGVTENGSLRNVTIKRKSKENINVDLYEALIFGDTDNIPFLMSGDSIHIEPVKNLVRAGYGFNNTAIFEMKDGETLNDLVHYSGGLKIESRNEILKLVRFENNKFNSYDIDSGKLNDYKIKNLDSVYAFKEKIGVVTISGNVKHPGKYSVSSSDKLLDLIQRSGGYNDSAYPFGASLYRDSSIKLEQEFARKSYKDLITFIVSNPSASQGGGDGLSFLLSELSDYQPLGRVIAEFDEKNLIDNIQDNIYLNDGDKIHVPTYSSNIYIFGEVGNPGSVLFKEDASMLDYINKSGGFTKFSSEDSVFIVSPNGETTKIQIGGIKRFLNQGYDVYPGSVIYVPRHIAKVQGVDLYATIAPIFSSLALSIASLNSLD